MVAKLGETFAEPSPGSSGCPLPADRDSVRLPPGRLARQLNRSWRAGRGFLLEHYGHQLNGARFRLREILHLCGDDALEEFTETCSNTTATPDLTQHAAIAKIDI